MHQFDVISIGDMVTDAFIKLFDDEEKLLHEKSGEWLAIPFGTKIPFQDVTVIEGVGNAANGAVSCARLGLHTSFVTNIGGDQEGRDMINALGKNQVDTRFVRVNPGKKSNYHYVLCYGAERTILIKHEEYDYHWPHLRPSETPRWAYFSSISEHAIEYHDQVADCDVVVRSVGGRRVARRSIAVRGVVGRRVVLGGGRRGHASGGARIARHRTVTCSLHIAHLGHRNGTERRKGGRLPGRDVGGIATTVQGWLSLTRSRLACACRRRGT